MKKIMLVLLLFLAGCGKNPFVPEEKKPDPTPVPTYTVTFEIKVETESKIQPYQYVKFGYEVNYPVNCAKYYTGPGYSGGGCVYVLPGKPHTENFTTCDGNNFSFKLIKDNSRDEIGYGVITLTLYKDGKILHQVTDGGLTEEIGMKGKF